MPRAGEPTLCGASLRLACSGGSETPPRADPAQRVLKAVLLLAAVVFLVVALARPAWDPVRQEVVQRGRDVVFVLDVSRSMMAEDLPPNRLERAKLAILDAVDRLEGDRVALAVFAGATVVKCPLTLDYAFFRMVLEDVSPWSVSRGGTLIGDALRTVLRDVFDGKRSNYRDIVLITDGEDHDSFPLEAAAEVGALGVRLIAIGLGDERVGQRIPVVADDATASANVAGTRSFLQHAGQEVWSRLDADTLRKMTDATPGGRYLNVATGAIDFGEVYRRLIASAAGREIGTRELERLEEKFQIFLAVCLLLLALEMLVRERKRGGVARGAALWLLAGCLAPMTVDGASVRGLVNEGNEAYRARAYDKALRSYDQAAEKDPESPYVSLNRANALYRNGAYDEAIEAYGKAVRQTLERNVPQLKASALHNLGNAYFRQGEQAAPTDPRQALQSLVQAARSYSDALRVDRGRNASAHNLEVTRRRIHELREQAQQQPQKGGQRDQDNDSQDQERGDRNEALERAAQEQQRLADESESLEQDRQQRRDADSRQQQQQRAQDLSDRQQDLREQTQQMAANADGPTRQQLEDAVGNQQQAQQDLEQGRPGEAEAEQREAAEALRRAADAREGPGQQPAEAQSAQASRQDVDMHQLSEREREMLTEQILVKEKLDRRRRQLLQRVGAVPVEKDW